VITTVKIRPVTSTARWRVARWTTLHPRPFRLLHTDLHRKNMIVSRGRTYFLDWELALWGDPVYDLAVHLHKMGCSPSEYEAAQAVWLASVPGEASGNMQAPKAKLNSSGNFPESSKPRRPLAATGPAANPLALTRS
jgi:aminoglycoside phosphotransferase (APT) family kinase protein